MMESMKVKLKKRPISDIICLAKVRAKSGSEVVSVCAYLYKGKILVELVQKGQKKSELEVLFDFTEITMQHINDELTNKQATDVVYGIIKEKLQEQSYIVTV